MTQAVCWICRIKPDSGEHRFKASDVRTRAAGLSQKKPIFLQRDGQATNDAITGAKARMLKFNRSICSDCNNSLTQPYDKAWERLSTYLYTNWPTIVSQGWFDLRGPFPTETRRAAFHVHLYFVKLFGCKLVEDDVPLDLSRFSRALLTGKAHPEVCVAIALPPSGTDQIMFYDSEVGAMRNQEGSFHGAIWMYVARPVAVKVGWIKAGAPLHLPGHPWHPGRPKRYVSLSPYVGGTEPTAGPGALIPPGQ